MRNPKNCHILLIGDHAEPEPDTLKLLDTLNTEVLYAGSGRDALARLLEHDVSLVMIDMSAESSPGMETAGLLRSSERFMRIPIVFLLPGHPTHGWTIPDFSGGIVDTLIKPLNPSIVKQKISLICQLKDYEKKAGRGPDKETREELEHSRRELEKANAELKRLTEDLEEAIEKANRMAVEAEMATISKSGFLAAMSHEIRTPLNAVIGFTELVLGTPLNEEQLEYIESIRSASNTFLDLINDILDYSKIEAEMIRLESIPFSPETCIYEVMTTLWMKAHEKKLGMGYRISPDVPEAVAGDPGRFKQILMNLVGNAIKFTAEGRIVIRLELDGKVDQGSRLHVAVSDSGIGIPESKMAMLFQPFSQANVAITREYGGTGLGLAISKKLASLMNGRIWIESPNPESAETRGTVFHVLLEFQAVESHNVTENRKNQEGHAGKVIVCHADSVMARLYGDSLNDYGFKTVCVTDPLALSEEVGRCGKTEETAVHCLLDDPDNVFDRGFIKDNLKGRIIVLENQGQPESPGSDENHGGDAVYIRKPIKTRYLIDALASTYPEKEKTVSGNKKDVFRASSHESLKVLLVEDNSINQKVTLKMLDRLGHRALLAENGKEALDILQDQDDVDVVLMDGQMPVMDGFQATEIIRLREKEGPENKHIPIIALTANAMKGDRKKFIDSGMDDYIAKPVGIVDLSEAIHRVRHGNKKAVPEPGSLEKQGKAPEF